MTAARAALALSFLLVLGAIPLASACAPAPQPAAAPVQASPAAAPAPPTKPVELRFASISAPTHVMNRTMHAPWIEQVDKASNGRLKVTMYPAGALGSAKEAYDLAAKGIADLSFGVMTYHPGRFPLTEAYQLPGMVSDVKSAYHLWDTYEKHLAKEWAETKVLWLGISSGFNIVTKSKPVRSFDDLKGLKMAVPGPPGIEVVRLAGGTPVEVAAQEMYIALERGTVDGGVVSWSSVASAKLGEVTSFYTKSNLYNLVFFVVMNPDSYKALPPDLKKIVDDNSGRKMSELATQKYWDEEADDLQRVVQQSGGKGTVIDLSSDERRRYTSLVRPMLDKWVKDGSAKGLPAQQTLDTVLGYLQ